MQGDIRYNVLLICACPARPKDALARQGLYSCHYCYRPKRDIPPVDTQRGEGTVCKKNHGDGSPDHFFTQRSFILSWHTIIIVGAVADLHVWLCRLQARTYSEYSKLFKGE